MSSHLCDRMGLFKNGSSGSSKKSRFTELHLRLLCSRLQNCAVIDESNADEMVEVIREMAELLVWGDQHSNDQFFDTFLESGVYSRFQKLLGDDVPKRVKVQVIQSLCILVQNISKETYLFFLYSNNQLNKVISHKFDYHDEEFLPYYITLLRMVSLKLNAKTIGFFYNKRAADFPLYTRAIRFFLHPERMVQTAVRTITLNVYRVDDPDTRKFVATGRPATYFDRLPRQLQKLVEQLIEAVNEDDSSAQNLLDEVLDLFFYISDVFAAKISTVSRLLGWKLLEHILEPICFHQLRKVPSHTRGGEYVELSTALFTLAQFFSVINDRPLVNYVFSALLSTPRDSKRSAGPSSWLGLDTLSESSVDTNAESSSSLGGSSLSSNYEPDVVEFEDYGNGEDLCKDMSFRSLQLEPEVWMQHEALYENIMQCLETSDDGIVTLTTLVLLLLCRNIERSRPLSERLRYLPYRDKRSRSLVDHLIEGSGGDSSGNVGGEQSLSLSSQQGSASVSSTLPNPSFSLSTSTTASLIRNTVLEDPQDGDSLSGSRSSLEEGHLFGRGGSSSFRNAGSLFGDSPVEDSDQDFLNIVVQGDSGTESGMTSAATSDAEGEGEAEENVGRRENWDCIWIEVCLGVMLGPVEDHEDEDEEELVMGRMMDVHGDGENVSSPAGDKMVDGVRRKGGLEDRVCIQVTGFRVLPGKYADPWTDRRGAQRKRRKRAINQRNLAVSETEDKPAAGHRSDVVADYPVNVMEHVLTALRNLQWRPVTVVLLCRLAQELAYAFKSPCCLIPEHVSALQDICRKRGHVLENLLHQHRELTMDLFADVTQEFESVWCKKVDYIMGNLEILFLGSLDKMSPIDFWMRPPRNLSETIRQTYMSFFAVRKLCFLFLDIKDNIEKCPYILKNKLHCLQSEIIHLENYISCHVRMRHRLHPIYIHFEDGLVFGLQPHPVEPHRGRIESIALASAIKLEAESSDPTAFRIFDSNPPVSKECRAFDFVVAFRSPKDAIEAQRRGQREVATAETLKFEFFQSLARVSVLD